MLHLIFPVFAIRLSENDNLKIAICSFRKFFVWQHRYVIPIRNQFAFYLFWDCNKIEHYANGENFTKRRPQSTNIWTKWCNYYWTKLFLLSNSNNLLSISILPCWNLHSNKKSKHIFNYALSVSGNVLCIGSDLDSHPCLNPSLFSALSWKSGSFFLNIVFEAGWVFCTSQLPISDFFHVFHQSCCSQSDGMLCRSTSTAELNSNVAS